MANTSISGLVSGLDTATIIDQLMQVEAQNQTALKTRLTSQQSKLKTFQDLNAKIAALSTQASDLTKPGAVNNLKATSSSTSVTATATSGTSAGSFDVHVNNVATTHRLTYATTANFGDHVTGATNDVTLTLNGVPKTITTDGTLNGLLSGLNAIGSGVKASTMRLDDGTQRLIVQSSTSGAAGSFTLTASDGADLLGGATVLTGQDASITVGTDTLHSATNTFSNLFAGVNVSVSAAAVGTTATINIDNDSSAAKSKVKALVDAVNGVLGQIDTGTTYNAATKIAGAFTGDPSIASLRTAVLSSVYQADGSSMSEFGLETDRNGKLVFDEAAFDTAYAADPAKVTKAFTDGTTGFAGRVKTQTAGASDASTGTLTAAINGQNTTIRSTQDSISDWDTRLTLRRASITRQFTALETAMSQMQSQSSWLSSQISSMNKSS